MQHRATSSTRCQLNSVPLLRMQGRLTTLEQPNAAAQELFEYIFHVEEGGPVHTGSVASYIIPDIINPMPITSVCAGSSAVLASRRDGASRTAVVKYSLPDLQQLQNIALECVPQCMALNCDNSKLAIIDAKVRIRFCCPVCPSLAMAPN